MSRFLRGLLTVLAVALLAWSFARVGWRTFTNWRDRAAVEKELVVLHWSGEGGPEEDAIVEGALRAGETLHDDFGDFVDENAHCSDSFN